MMILTYLLAFLYSLTYCENFTQLEDINNELRHYREHFRGKTVLCNCDDPRVSNFFIYFANNFHKLGLKKLIATCYKSQDVDLFSQNASEQAVYMVYEGQFGDNGLPDPQSIDVKPLKGDGDFRSPECVEFLKEADIVVTNPPFSLFREYVAQLIKYDKKFLIIGNKNCVKYKEIFPLFQANKLWAGFTPWSGGMWFETNGGFYDKKVNGKTLSNVPAIWITNIDHRRRHEDIILYKSYSSEIYPKFENFDAINVNRTEDIPIDYDGIMGVPISFLDKYNPDQFEILGVGIAGLGLAAGVQPYKLEHKKYRKEIQKRGAVDGDLYMMNGEEVVVPYSRILIRKKK